MAKNQPLLAAWSELGLVTIQKRSKLLIFSPIIPNASPTLLKVRLSQLVPLPRLIGCILAGALLSFSCGHARAAPSNEKSTVLEKGVASYYSRFYQGRRTSSGTRYDPKKFTAAHPWLPLGTRLRVTATDGRSVDVVVTDRMSATHRIIDLSMIAAQKLGIVGRGLAEVSLSRL